MVASVGTESGYVPYTAYSTTKEFLAKNKELLQSFTKAIEKGQKYVEEHTAAEVAKVIAPQFKETDEKTIEKSLIVTHNRTAIRPIPILRKTALP